MANDNFMPTDKGPESPAHAAAQTAPQAVQDGQADGTDAVESRPCLKKRSRHFWLKWRIIIYIVASSLLLGWSWKYSIELRRNIPRTAKAAVSTHGRLLSDSQPFYVEELRPTKPAKTAKTTSQPTTQPSSQPTTQPSLIGPVKRIALAASQPQSAPYSAGAIIFRPQPKQPATQVAGQATEDTKNRTNEKAVVSEKHQPTTKAVSKIPATQVAGLTPPSPTSAPSSTTKPVPAVAITATMPVGPQTIATTRPVPSVANAAATTRPAPNAQHMSMREFCRRQAIAALDPWMVDPTWQSERQLTLGAPRPGNRTPPAATANKPYTAAALPVRAKGAVSANGKPLEGRYRLSAIVLGSSPKAMINGRFVRLQEEIDDAKVVMIRRQSVDLQIDGKVLTLRL